MNPLLKRQIRKYLPEDLKDREDLGVFFNAVSASYNTLEDQFKMTQRAMKISSDELFAANQKLREETAQQKKLLSKLQVIINAVEPFDVELQDGKEPIELDSSNLVDYIDKQAQQLIEINKKQERLLNDLAIQNQELSDYAHIVSHDLKSPLRSIEALVSWLKEDYANQLGEDGKLQIALIGTQLEKMDALISGILRYSSIDKGVSTEYTIPLNQVVHDTLGLLTIPEHIEIDIGVLPTITADRFKIQQLFQNLLGNAIANMDKESGHIRVLARKKGNKHQFEIIDNGKGINPSYFKKIFQVFQKLESESNSTGIGLSIVKKIISFYGGTIWLESEEGAGTTFYFTLPATE